MWFLNRYCNSRERYVFNMDKIVEKQEQEELDGRAVSALSVRSRKLSTGLNGQS
jgi:hypothetical protein